MQTRQLRLGIERVHLRRPAIGEDMDDVFRLRGKLRRVAQQRIRRGGRALAGQGLQGQRTQPHAAPRKEVAARGEKVTVIGGVGAGHGVPTHQTAHSIPEAGVLQKFPAGAPGRFFRFPLPE
jgi:hypothetical protein